MSIEHLHVLFGRILSVKAETIMPLICYHTRCLHFIFVDYTIGRKDHFCLLILSKKNLFFVISLFALGFR